MLPCTTSSTFTHAYLCFSSTSSIFSSFLCVNLFHPPTHPLFFSLSRSIAFSCYLLEAARSFCAEPRHLTLSSYKPFLIAFSCGVERAPLRNNFIPFPKIQSWIILALLPPSCLLAWLACSMNPKSVEILPTSRVWTQPRNVSDCPEPRLSRRTLNADSIADNSTMSNNDQSVTTPLSATYQSSGADMSPSPIHTNLGHSVHSPASGGMSVASMVSPTTGLGDHSLFRHSDRHSFPNSTGMSVNGDSRRESVDSRLGHNFGDLRLAVWIY